jgi:hypothetical protein
MSTPSSVHKQILDEILRVLKEDVVFNVAPDDSCKPIPPQNIEFQKVSIAERDIDTGRALERFPMIIVSVPFEEPFNPNAATNAHDEYRWSFLCQIIDRDNHEKTRSIDTYWTWQETISQRFQFMCMQNVDAQHCIANAMSVDTVDERYWIKQKNFKAGVQILARPWIRGFGR